MTFSNNHKFTTATSNGCLMDSDKSSLEGGPTQSLDSSWIPKEYTNATMEGTGFTNGTGKITFVPVQVVADKSVSIEARGCYKATFSGPIGGFGQTDHTVHLKGLCGDDQYVFVRHVNVYCSVDNEGSGVVCSLIPESDGTVKSNALKFRSVNMDEASATTTRTFTVFIEVVAELSNVDFGLGQLFPKE